MKKIMYFAAALLVLAGCQSSQEARENAPAEMVTIKGRIELPQGPNKIAPKSDWKETTVEGDINFQWEIGDSVAVYTNDKTGFECKKFIVTSIDNESGIATLAGEALSKGMNKYSIVYPYTEITSSADIDKLLMIQTYKQNSFNPVVAGQGNGNAFTLNTFIPAIHLQLKGAVLLGKIEYRGTHSDAVSVDVEATAQMTFGTGLKLDNTTPTDVVLFVPVDNYEEFELSFYDTAGQLIMKKQSATELTPNTIIPFPVLTVAEPFVPTYVDLGLPSGLKWATCNVGATTPEGYGDYFAWGETQPYYEDTTANPITWKTGKSSGYAWQSYCGQSDFKEWSPAPFDATTKILTSAYDAASVNWGGGWRMPTEAEFQELLDNCDKSWTTQNGVNGCLFTSKKEGYTDKSIFLPAAGYFSGTSRSVAGSCGLYWSSSLSTSYSRNGCYLCFHSDNVYMDGTGRFYGQSVRPVCK